MYFDGQQTAQTEKDCSKDTHGSSDFGVNIGGGGIWDATGNWFTGAMEEVAIFHSALSNADVNKIMKTGFTFRPGSRVEILCNDIVPIVALE